LNFHINPNISTKKHPKSLLIYALIGVSYESTEERSSSRREQTKAIRSGGSGTRKGTGEATLKRTGNGTREHSGNWLQTDGTRKLLQRAMQQKTWKSAGSPAAAGKF
jgi:hypothetical protein